MLGLLPYYLKDYAIPFYNLNNLKDLQNRIGKLFLHPPQNKEKTQPTF